MKGDKLRRVMFRFSVAGPLGKAKPAPASPRNGCSSLARTLALSFSACSATCPQGVPF